MTKIKHALANLADLERAAADLAQPPQPPRQRADIVMCDWCAAWWVNHTCTMMRGKLPVCNAEPPVNGFGKAA